jgi:hypothetical protein
MVARNRYLQVQDEPTYEKDIDAQIARLREILRLMTPESGSAALGALRRAAPEMPLRERVKAIGASRS